MAKPPTKKRLVAESVKQWFKRKNFLPYVAIHAQSLEDVDGIIEELKRSDFYVFIVFIDFRRERLPRSRLFGLCDSRRWRGSLFTHQELAIAKLLRFSKVIFLQQEGAKRARRGGERPARYCLDRFGLRV